MSVNHVELRPPVATNDANSATPAGAAGDGVHDEHEHFLHRAFEWPEALRIALVALAAAVIWFRIWEPFSRISVVGVVGLVSGAVLRPGGVS